VNSKPLAALFVGFSLAATSCSSEPAGGPSTGSDPGQTNGAPGPASANGETGSIGFQLTLPDGSGVDTVQWAISGPNNAETIVQSGKVDVHASGGTMFLVSKIPVASGYHVVLSASSVDGGVSCEGSAPFAVSSRATSQVDVQLACNAASAGGHTTLVDGTSFDCAAWNSVAASPTETAVGSAVSLSATATGPMPANLTYRWSAPSGQFANATAANTSFTCTAAGPVMVTLVVGDGAVPEGSTCNPAVDTDVITITCTGGTGPVPAPAMPPWGPIVLASGLLGLGGLSRRAKPAAI
jgi:hypothetical protein